MPIPHEKYAHSLSGSVVTVTGCEFVEYGVVIWVVDSDSEPRAIPLATFMNEYTKVPDSIRQGMF